MGYEEVLKFKIVASNLRTDNFSVTWSINHTDFKKMKLTTTGNYDEMVGEAIEKAKPSVKLDMAECSVKVRIHIALKQIPSDFCLVHRYRSR